MMNARTNSKLGGSPSSEEDESPEKKRQANEPNPNQPFNGASGFHETSGNDERKKKAARRNSAGESRRAISSPNSNAAVDSTRASVQQLLQPYQSGLQAQLNADPSRERQILLDHLVRQRLQDGFQQAELRGLQLPGMPSFLPGQQPSSVHEPLTQTELHELLVLHSSQQQQNQLERRQLPAVTASSMALGVAAAQSSLANSPSRERAHPNISSTSEQVAPLFLPGGGSSNQDPVLENMLQELLRREIAAQDQRILIEQYLAANRQDFLGSSTNSIRMPDVAHALPYDRGDAGLLAVLASRQQQQQQQSQSSAAAAAAAAASPGDSLRQSSSRGIRKTKTIPLALSTDSSQLSRYQVLVRQQLELFVADREDVTTSIQGRKKDVAFGQVGLRCIHCAHFPVSRRGRGSVYYPRKLTVVYQACQNMSITHLQDACVAIPRNIREELTHLHKIRETTSGGKPYWAQSCSSMGLIEDEHGLRFAEDAAADDSSRKLSIGSGSVRSPGSPRRKA